MKHLTLSQRYKIEALLELNNSKSEIARQLGVDKSTVGREMNYPGASPEVSNGAAVAAI